MSPSPATLQRPHTPISRRPMIARARWLHCVPEAVPAAAPVPSRATSSHPKPDLGPHAQSHPNMSITSHPQIVRDLAIASAFQALLNRTRHKQNSPPRPGHTRARGHGSRACAACVHMALTRFSNAPWKLITRCACGAPTPARPATQRASASQRPNPTQPTRAHTHRAARRAFRCGVEPGW